MNPKYFTKKVHRFNKNSIFAKIMHSKHNVCKT